MPVYPSDPPPHGPDPQPDRPAHHHGREPGLRRREPGLRRRALLAGAAGGLGLAALAGCEPSPAPRWEGPSELAPVLSAAVYLAARYDITIEALPDLASRLTPLRDEHRAHITALTRELGSAESGVLPSGQPPAVPPSPSASGSARPSTPAEHTGRPTDRASALATLRELERIGRLQATAACLAASWFHAALLGSIAAARASHLEVLT